MKKVIIGFAFMLQCGVLGAQSVGIGTNTPHPSALLEVKSSTGGLLLPRMSSINRNNIISPPEGLTIFNTSFNRFEQYNGTGRKNFLPQRGFH